MLRIMVVDDDADFVAVTSTVLHAEGYEVTCASNGKEALAFMQTQQPNLVLLDVMMSYRLDGLDVADAMRRDPALASVPILMISSLPSARLADIIPARSCVPLEHWLCKPVSPDELLRHVGRLVDSER
jgi:CheY-like chemotaxis protein